MRIFGRLGVVLFGPKRATSTLVSYSLQDEKRVAEIQQPLPSLS